MTRPSRDGLEPGMIVEHRQRYVVTNQRYPDESPKHAGQLKLRPVGDVEQVAIAYADRGVRANSPAFPNPLDTDRQIRADPQSRALGPTPNPHHPQNHDKE